jgi:CRP/FNR family transcriptional regulator
MINSRVLAEQLRNVPQFNDLPYDAILRIVNFGQIKHFTRGETIIHEEEPCAGMFVLVEGGVNLCKFGPEGQTSILATLSPVIMFNEVAVLDGGPNPVSAVASSDILVWHISHADFQKILLSYPQVGIALLGILARRNRLLIAHYDDLSFRTVQARLAKHLIDISQQGNITINRSDHPAKIIAARIVTTPEAVSRTLKVFKLDEIISCTRSEINIKDLKRLQNLACMDF